MIASFWNNITEAVGQFINLLGKIFTQISALFFNATTVGETTTYEPTFLGLLMFVALGSGLAWVVFAIIRKLIKMSIR